MGTTQSVIANKVSFRFSSSNYDGSDRWGSFHLVIEENDEYGAVQSSILLEKHEMQALANELLAVARLVVD